MYKVCNFFVSMFFLVFFKIDFFKTKIFICFNSPGLFVHLLCLSLVQEDFRTGFIFIVALTKKKCLPLKLFLRQIGPNWGSGLSKTIVPGQPAVQGRHGRLRAGDGGRHWCRGGQALQGHLQARLLVESTCPLITEKSLFLNILFCPATRKLLRKCLINPV